MALNWNSLIEHAKAAGVAVHEYEEQFRNYEEFGDEHTVERVHWG